MLAKCFEWLKREEFKTDLKEVLHPVFEMLIQALKPYLLYGIAFILLNFILLLSILFYIMRGQKNLLIL